MIFGEFYNDQPHFNFHLIHNGLVEMDAFKPLVQNRSSAETAVKNGLAIVHMAGCPGHSNIKIDLCRDFMQDYEQIQPSIIVKILEEPKCCPTCGKPLDK